MTGTDAAGARRSRRRWLASFLAAALVVVGGAEVAVRLLDRRLPTPREYYSDRAQTVAHDMDRWRRAGIRSDLVFVGTSQVARGAVPRVFEDRLGLSWVGNVALPGAQTPVVQRWMTEEVMPRLRPRRVVYGISSIDFNGGRPQPVIDQYDAARATRAGPMAAIDREFSGTVALAEHRAELRDPVKLAEAARGTRAAPGRPKPLAELLPQLSKRPTGVNYAQKGLQYLREKQLGNFTVTPGYLGAFRSTLESLHSAGVETVVVVMPVPSQYRIAHPRGPAQYEAWKRAAVAVARETGTRVIDLDRSMPDAVLPDFVHLTPEAARTWSGLLADRLGALGWTERRATTP